ncbi:MAG TPA: type IV pilus biogenesis/stability protein PilW [Rhodocyclaceae bacterium]|nr:type IV pilus biogenesis/stability protein PilW [Rhodocyclaceae bacterium]
MHIMMIASRSIATFLALTAALLLTACSGNVRNEAPAEQPVSQQNATSDVQQRAKVHTELGMMYMQRGNMGVALDEARAALSADANYAPAHNLMGLAYMQLRENQAAESSFERALSLAPNDPEINNGFGWFLCQTGREQRSLSYFSIAIKSPLYKTPAMSNTNAGICSIKLKDDKAAEDYLMRALHLDANNPRAIFFLADIAYRQDRLAVARLHLNELHKIADSTPESVWLALRVERKLGDREAEARYAIQLNRNFPGSPEQLKLSQRQYE